MDFLFKYIRSQKKTFTYLLIIVFINALFEIVLLFNAAIFFQLFFIPSSEFGISIIQIFYNFFKIDITMANIFIFFCISIIISNIFRSFLLREINLIVHSTGSNLAYEIFKKLYFSDYTYLKNISSSNAITILNEKISIFINGFINPLVTILTSSFISMFILSYIIIKNPLVFIITSSIIILVYLINFLLIKKQIKISSQIISINMNKTLNVIRNFFDNLEYNLVKEEKKLDDIFYSHDKERRLNQAKVAYLSQYPKYILEISAIIAILISFSIYKYYFLLDESFIFYSIGLLLTAFYRLMPLTHQIFSSFITILGNKTVINDVNYTFHNLYKINRVSINHHNYKKIKFKFSKNIEIRNLSLKFKDRYLFKNLNFKIEPNDKILIYGKSGSGKTSFINVFLNLIKPSSGGIFIDGANINKIHIKDFYKNISLVNQFEFFESNNMLDTIVGDRAVNKNKITEVLDIVGLNKFFDKDRNLNSNINIGDNGKLLSGGERRRLAIARSLYKNAKIIIMDEPTKGLDKNLEKKIIDYLFSSNCTIILISHSQYIINKFKLKIKIH